MKREVNRLEKPFGRKFPRETFRRGHGLTQLSSRSGDALRTDSRWATDFRVDELRTVCDKAVAALWLSEAANESSVGRLFELRTFGR